MSMSRMLAILEEREIFKIQKHVFYGVSLNILLLLHCIHSQKYKNI